MQFENLANADNLYTAIPAVPTVPYFTVAADFVFSGDASSNDQLRIGIFKDFNNRVAASFDLKAGQVNWQIRLNSTDRFVSTQSYTLTGFTRFAMSLLGQRAIAWGWNGKVWVALRTALIDTAWHDFTTDISGYLFSFHGRSNGTAKQRISNIRVSPFGGSGLRDFKLVTYENGEPVIHGRDMYLTGTLASPDDDDGVGTSIGIFALDYQSQTIRQVGRVLFEESGQIFGGAAAKIVFDRNLGEWWVFISTYGAAAGVDVAFVKTLSSPLHGSHLLSDLTRLSPSQNDADLYFDGSAWHLVYGSAATTPAYRTASTVPGLAAAPPVALGPTDEEGNNLRVIGGVPYWMTIDRTAGTWNVYRLSDRASIGTLNKPTIADSGSAHPNVIPVAVPGGTKYVIITFAGGSFPVAGASAPYGNGDYVVCTSEVVAGTEYPDPFRLA